MKSNVTFEGVTGSRVKCFVRLELSLCGLGIIKGVGCVLF